MSNSLNRMPNWNFQLWLDQEFPISYEEVVDRRTSLTLFAHDLTYFMKIHGYTMDSRWNTGVFAVARWIYKIHCDTSTRCPKILHRNYEEDRDQYLDTVTDSALADFLRLWNHMPDFDYDTKNGRLLWDELQDMLWSYVDLEESTQGMQVVSWFDDSDSDSDGGNGKVDVYIQDSAAGWHSSRN